MGTGSNIFQVETRGGYSNSYSEMKTLKNLFSYFWFLIRLVSVCRSSNISLVLHCILKTEKELNTMHTVVSLTS